jgi:hypothetical protein
MSGCKPASTPLAVGTRLTHSQSSTTPEECAAYAQSSNSIKILAQFGANPGMAHIEAFKQLLHYLKGTVVLMLGSKDTGTDLIGWTNSDWAQDLDSRC